MFGGPGGGQGFGGDGSGKFGGGGPGGGGPGSGFGNNGGFSQMAYRGGMPSSGYMLGAMLINNPGRRLQANNMAGSRAEVDKIAPPVPREYDSNAAKAEVDSIAPPVPREYDSDAIQSKVDSIAPRVLVEEGKGKKD